MGQFQQWEEDNETVRTVMESVWDSSSSGGEGGTVLPRFFFRSGGEGVGQFKEC